MADNIKELADALTRFTDRLGEKRRAHLRQEFHRLYGSEPATLELLSYAIEQDGDAYMRDIWKRHSQLGTIELL